MDLFITFYCWILWPASTFVLGLTFLFLVSKTLIKEPFLKEGETYTVVTVIKKEPSEMWTVLLLNEKTGKRTLETAFFETIPQTGMSYIAETKKLTVAEQQQLVKHPRLYAGILNTRIILKSC